MGEKRESSESVTVAAVKAAVPPMAGESAAAYEALVNYIVEGGGTWAEVAARTGRGRSTIWGWTSRFRWRERAQRFWSQAIPEWAALAVDGGRSVIGWRERAVAQMDERRRQLAEREWAAHEELLRIADQVIERWKKGAWDRRAAPLGALAALIDLTFRLGRGGTGEQGGVIGGPSVRVLSKTLDEAYGGR